MKRYALFCGERYYPRGGWKDFHSTYDDVESAMTAAPGIDDGWAQIVDMQSDPPEIVHRGMMDNFWGKGTPLSWYTEEEYELDY